MVELAGADRKEQLKKIWLQCYEDPEAYVDFFMEKGFPNCRCLCYVEEGVAVGALYLMDCVLSDKKGLYWYAGGVLPAFRKRGFYQKIIDAALELAEKENKVSLCVPAPGLEPYYRKQGLTDTYSCEVFTLQGQPGDHLPLVHRRISQQEYCRRCAGTVGANAAGSVRWTQALNAYVWEEVLWCGGICEEVTIEDRQYFLLGQVQENILQIAETNIPLPLLSERKDGLLAAFGGSSIRCQYPVGEYPEQGGQKTMSAMGNGGYESDKKWFVLTMV